MSSSRTVELEKLQSSLCGVRAIEYLEICFCSIIFSLGSHLIAKPFAKGESSYYFTYLQVDDYLVLCFLGVFLCLKTIDQHLISVETLLWN